MTLPSWLIWIAAIVAALKFLPLILGMLRRPQAA